MHEAFKLLHFALVEYGIQLDCDTNGCEYAFYAINGVAYGRIHIENNTTIIFRTVYKTYRIDLHDPDSIDKIAELILKDIDELYRNQKCW